jgi:hypothetical protein
MQFKSSHSYDSDPNPGSRRIPRKLRNKYTKNLKYHKNYKYPSRYRENFVQQLAILETSPYAAKFLAYKHSHRMGSIGIRNIIVGVPPRKKCREKLVYYMKDRQNVGENWFIR